MNAVTTLTNSAQEIHDSIREMMQPLEAPDSTTPTEQFQIGVLKMMAKIAYELEKINASKSN